MRESERILIFYYADLHLQEMEMIRPQNSITESEAWNCGSLTCGFIYSTDDSKALCSLNTYPRMSWLLKK